MPSDRIEFTNQGSVAKVTLNRPKGCTQLITLFHVANSLHSNFYENWDPPEVVEAGFQDVQLLLEKLEPLLE